MTAATRVAIVTGSAQGIGRAIALRLATDGLDVALNDLPSQTAALKELVAEIQKKGRKAIYFTGDVSQEADVLKLVDETVAQLGGLDVMVANAGILIPTPIVGQISAAQFHTAGGSDLGNWQKIWEVNAKGTFLCYQLAAKQMVRQGRGGRIIGASSCTGIRGMGYIGAYCSTKFAIRGLTQCAATELAAHKIQVNAYAPGIIDTPMTNPAGTPEGLAVAKQAVKDPNAPTGTPEDIANLVSYLASPEAYFVSGQTLAVGGHHVLT